MGFAPKKVLEISRVSFSKFSMLCRDQLVGQKIKTSLFLAK